MNADPFDQVAAEIRAARAAAAGQENWRRIAPARFADATIETLIGRGRAGEQIAEWSFGPEGRNLIITGPVGTGKTWAALAAVRGFVEAGSDVRFWPTVELLDELRPGSTETTTLEAACTCDVLVLDDLGVERPTDWVAERLYAIVNRRWMDNRVTVATTNAATSDELAAHVGDRMRSRLVGSGAVVVRLTGPDRRKEPATPTTKDQQP